MLVTTYRFNDSYDSRLLESKHVFTAEEFWEYLDAVALLALALHYLQNVRPDGLRAAVPVDCLAMAQLFNRDYKHGSPLLSFHYAALVAASASTYGYR